MLSQQQSGINYAEIFKDRLLYRIEHIETSGENKRYLVEAVQRYDPERLGLARDNVVKYLKEVGVVITPWGQDLRKQRLDRSIELAVAEAGAHTLRSLSSSLSRRKGNKVIYIGDIYQATKGILKLAPFYGNERTVEYSTFAQKYWDETVSETIGNNVAIIKKTAADSFDPRKTPIDTHTAAVRLDKILGSYNIDPKLVKDDVNGIVKDTYRRAYHELIPITLDEIEHQKPETHRRTTIDIHATLFYGWMGDVSMEDIKAAKQKMVEAHEFGGRISRDIGEILLQDRDWMYKNLADYVRERGESFIHSAESTSSTIEDAIREVERLDREAKK